MKNVISNINFVLSVGSVDGVCTAAAVLRNAAYGAAIEFAQAFTVDRVDPSAWDESRNVLFVDLAVNNREPAMTVDLLRRVAAAGHQIIGVLDEHNAEDWRAAFAAAGLSFDDLAIKPVSQEEGDIKSSGALLRELMSADDQVNNDVICQGYPLLLDSHTRELCEAADAGDRMDFSTHFGGIVNQAVKSRIADDSRRVYLARHFAQSAEPDEVIRGWVTEYEQILNNHELVVGNRQYLGDGIVRINTTGIQVDMTTLMSRLFKDGARVVVCEAEMFNKSLGRKTRKVSFGANREGPNVLAAIKAAGVEASGFAQKANVEPEDEEAALAAVRALLRG